MSVVRVLNWRRHLLAWAPAQLGHPFAWGTCDCGHLARGALSVMLGRPIGAELPAYQDLEGAQAVWAAVGGLRGYLTGPLAAQSFPGKLGRPGDILVVPTEGFETALVFVDRQLLGVEPGKTAGWYELAAVQDRATAYRVGA